MTPAIGKRAEIGDLRKTLDRSSQVFWIDDHFIFSRSIISDLLDTTAFHLQGDSSLLEVSEDPVRFYDSLEKARP